MKTRGDIRGEVALISKLFLLNFLDEIRSEVKYLRDLGEIKKLNESKQRDFKESYHTALNNVRELMNSKTDVIVKNFCSTYGEWISKVEKKFAKEFNLIFSFNSVIKDFEKKVYAMCDFYNNKNFSDCEKQIEIIRKNPNYLSWLERYTKYLSHK